MSIIQEPMAVTDAVFQRAVRWLTTLVDIDATSGQEKAITDGFVRLAEDLQVPVQRWPVAPGRDNVLMGATKPRLVLCTHIDTVPPHIGSSQGLNAHGNPSLFGRGSADAGGVAVAMAFALKALTDAGLGESVAAWLVVGEETDHSGAEALLDYPDPPSVVILGEPCGGLPVRGQKGLLKLRLTASGVAAHSAYPELGQSAVHALLRALTAILDTPLPEDREALGETTVNVGLVQGGTAPNVVAPTASATVLIRCAAPVDAIASAVNAAVHEAVGPSVTIDELNRAEPLEFLSDEALLGTSGSGPPVPFNTDAHTLGPLKATMLLMGPGDMRCCHGPDEHLPLEALRAAIADYAAVATRLLR